jgi:hypothetical protein
VSTIASRSIAGKLHNHLKSKLELNGRAERHFGAAILFDAWTEPKRFTAKLAKRAKPDGAGDFSLGLWVRSIPAPQQALSLDLLISSGSRPAGDAGC